MGGSPNKLPDANGTRGAEVILPLAMGVLVATIHTAFQYYVQGVKFDTFSSGERFALELGPTFFSSLLLTIGATNAWSGRILGGLAIGAVANILLGDIVQAHLPQFEVMFRIGAPIVSPILISLVGELISQRR